MQALWEKELLTISTYIRHSTQSQLHKSLTVLPHPLHPLNKIYSQLIFKTPTYPPPPPPPKNYQNNTVTYSELQAAIKLASV
jgi:hypothetical protein